MSMHPSIQAALIPAAWQVSLRMGVESDADLAFLFTHEKDMFDIVSEPAVLESLTHAWRIARVRADVLLQQQPRKVPRISSDSAPVLAAGAGLRPKMRCKPPAQLMPRPFRAAYVAKPLKEAPALQEGKMIKLLTLEIVVSSASENLVFGREVWKNSVETFDLFAARFRNVTEERLNAHVSTFRRWLRWHAAHVVADVPYRRPTPVWLARFLEHVAQGGATAAPQVYASRRCWFSVVGLPLPIRDGLVEALSTPVNEHVVQPRTPLPLTASRGS